MGLLDSGPRAPRGRGSFVGIHFLTRAHVTPVGRFWRSIRHMTSFMQGCAFWGFCWYIFPSMGSNHPQICNFGGMNRHFQAKCAKYSNFHIIKTTAWIQPNLHISIRTTKYASWVIQKRGKQIQDGGRQPSWKIEKSWYLSNSLTDFDKI